MAELYRNNPQGGDTLSAVLLPCTEFIPTALAVAASFSITLDKAGGSSSGTLSLVVDSDAPFSCTEQAITGQLTLTPLLFGNDTDGDGCSDWYELGENPALGGLNDPFNPNDCDGIAPGPEVLTADGLYEISHGLLGGYRRCMGAVTGTTSLSMRVYCYTDIFGKEINPEGYPGAIGDGLPGAPPPGPETSPGSGNLVYGDVNAAHAELTGSLVGTKVSLSGCFEDLDVSDPLGDIYVEWTWNVQTGAGTSKTWTGQCNNSGASGDGALQAMKLATTAQMNACYTTDPLCPYADNDVATVDRDGAPNGALDGGDGMPDHFELRDNAVCGRRDPFNQHDYYDVSIPRDGVIDLFNDIVRVQANYDPDGLNAGNAALSGPGNQINYDRPPMITGNSGAWNRGSPDGVINLFNDISGVIAQYNPDGVNNTACQ